jgi:hypothetical protein
MDIQPARELAGVTEVEMTRAMDTPFFEDTTGRRRQTSRKTRHAVRSHLHVAQFDEEILDGAVLPVVPHDVGRRSSPKAKKAPTPGHRGGFKVWKTSFWKRRRRLWAERNAAARAIAETE